ncbi:MAG: NADH-quinone oxidoreductase subunit C [bacterium]
MPETSNITAIDEKFEVKHLDKTSDGIEIIEVPKDKLIELVTYLKMHVNTQFNMLFSVSGLDRVDCFEVVYNFYSTVFHKKLLLKVNLEKENPGVESLCGLYSAADWHERETYDLLGINFYNHPNLERILLPKDWIGHPLRKDYVNKDKRLNWNER